MTKLKDKRLIGRVTEDQHKKVMRILKDKGVTFSEWLRLKIERAK